MKETDDGVGAAKQHGVVFKGARDRERDEEHRPHRGEHRQTNATLIDVERAGEPRVDGPRPPEGSQDEYASQDPTPRWVTYKEPGHLGEREHHGQIEEQLQRRDLRLALPVDAIGIPGVNLGGSVPGSDHNNWGSWVVGAEGLEPPTFSL